MEDVKTKNVTLTMEQYEALLGRVSKLEGGTQVLSKKDRVVKHYATVMFFSDKPVVLFDDIKSEEYLDTKGELQVRTSNKIGIHLMADDKLEKHEVNYLSLMQNSRRYRAEIVKREATEVTAPQGSLPETIRTTPEDPVGLRDSNKQFHSEEVLLEHTFIREQATVKFIEGPLKDTQIVLDCNSLNR